MKKITAALIGAGSRGMYSLAPYALKHPNEIQFVAVAEPDKKRRELFRDTYKISEENCFESWEVLLEKPRLADAILICSQDDMHFEPTIRAIEQGYHILLEKPMSNDPLECVIIGEYAKRYDKVISICHVLRYTEFFSTVKALLDNGRIGRLISVQHNENVGHIHQSHSFVRGNWRNSRESSPMILAKSCHDMDILLWLVGSDCLRISSFGALTHFKGESAPVGAPERCLQGCPAEKECPYYAPKIYLTENTEWPTNVICNDMSMEGRRDALKTGPYGRCVYKCDNDVVDHQVVNMEFANEVTAAFSMCAFTNEISRTFKLMGTKGEIRGHINKNEIEVLDFSTGTRDVITLKEQKHGHGGGDYNIMYDFIRLIQESDGKQGVTSAAVSVQSHIMALAAEKSRVEGKIVNIREYMDALISQGKNEILQD